MFSKILKYPCNLGILEADKDSSFASNKFSVFKKHEVKYENNNPSSLINNYDA